MVSGLKTQTSNGILFLSKNALARDFAKLRTPLHPLSRKVNRQLSEAATNYHYFDLTDSFCNQQGCQRVTEDGYVVIFDESHLSEKGAKFVANNIADKAWLGSVLKYQKGG